MPRLYTPFERIEGCPDSLLGNSLGVGLGIANKAYTSLALGCVAVDGLNLLEVGRRIPPLRFGERSSCFRVSLALIAANSSRMSAANCWVVFMAKTLLHSEEYNGAASPEKVAV